MAWRVATVFYFLGWLLLAIISAVLNCLNYDWEYTTIVQGIFLIIFLLIVETSVLELVIIALAAIAVKCCGYRRQRTAPYDNLTLLMNYNLLALSMDDIEETFETMFQSYMGNLSPNVSVVLVSATRNPRLKDFELQMRDNYRALVNDVLRAEGANFAAGNHNQVDPIRLETVWRRYSHLDRDIFLQQYLPDICHYYANEFMCIQRVSRVLKKCGQYQDLMLLSELGSNVAYTYTSRDLYGDLARIYGEPMFYENPDVSNIRGRRFDYTLVLDCDTEVHAGGVHQLMNLAAAYPEKGIIQPAIKLKAREKDSMFMHLERLRQDVHEPFTRVMAEVMDQCGYYGKALIKNRIYIDQVIGTPDNLLEKVPIDVLSHDTFEAALLKPMYAPNMYLYESPCFNYITWNLREGRWNRGEVLLSMYFSPWFGSFMRLLQRAFQGDKAKIPKLRTKSKFDFISAYIAYSAFRQMLMKPFLLMFILVHVGIRLHYYWIPFAAVMFLVIVFPKFAVISCSNIKAVLIETLCSIIQFTPEAVIGTVRLFSAIESNVCSCCPGWQPQRSLEEELRTKNPFRTSLKYLWPYMVVSLVCIILILPFAIHFFMYILFVSVFILPFYCGLTSFDKNLNSAASHSSKRQSYRAYKANDDGDSIVSDVAVSMVNGDNEALVHRHRVGHGPNYKSVRQTTPEEWDRLVSAV